MLLTKSDRGGQWEWVEGGMVVTREVRTREVRIRCSRAHASSWSDRVSHFRLYMIQDKEKVWYLPDTTRGPGRGGHAFRKASRAADPQSPDCKRQRDEVHERTAGAHFNGGLREEK